MYDSTSLRVLRGDIFTPNRPWYFTVAPQLQFLKNHRLWTSEVAAHVLFLCDASHPSVLRMALILIIIPLIHEGIWQELMAIEAVGC